MGVAPPPGTPVLQMSRVVRGYQALRPLRIAALALGERERIAVSGVDAAGAEVLVNLITGAALPEEGEVRVFGRDTSEISSGDEWLAWLDRFGIVSPRAVLLEGATIQQNLAMPFTLEIDPIPAGFAVKVEGLARDCGIAIDLLAKPAAAVSPEVRARMHLARAIALDPALLLLEHPTAGIGASAVRLLADHTARVLESRGLSVLVITEDDVFASRVAHRTLRLQPATGELKPVRRGWFR